MMSLMKFEKFRGFVFNGFTQTAYFLTLNGKSLLQVLNMG